MTRFCFILLLGVFATAVPLINAGATPNFAIKAKLQKPIYNPAKPGDAKLLVKQLSKFLQISGKQIRSFRITGAKSFEVKFANGGLAKRFLRKYKKFRCKTRSGSTSTISGLKAVPLPGPGAGRFAIDRNSGHQVKHVSKLTGRIFSAQCILSGNIFSGSKSALPDARLESSQHVRHELARLLKAKLANVAFVRIIGKNSFEVQFASAKAADRLYRRYKKIKLSSPSGQKTVSIIRINRTPSKALKKGLVVTHSAECKMIRPIFAQAYSSGDPLALKEEKQHVRTQLAKILGVNRKSIAHCKITAVGAFEVTFAKKSIAKKFFNNVNGITIEATSGQKSKIRKVIRKKGFAHQETEQGIALTRVRTKKTKFSATHKDGGSDSDSGDPASSSLYNMDLNRLDIDLCNAIVRSTNNRWSSLAPTTPKTTQPTTTKFTTMSTPTTESPDCDKKPHYVMILMDASGSVSAQEFARQKDFVIDLIGQLPGDAQIAIMQYASKQKWELKFGPKRTLTQVQNLVPGFKKEIGGTLTALALKTAKAELQKNNAASVTLVVMVQGRISDWRHRRGANIAAAIHAMGTDTYAVGIGDKVDRKELREIASKRKNVILAENYDKLNEDLAMDISEGKCRRGSAPPEPSPTEHICRRSPIDVVLLIDGSGSVNEFEFQQQLNFASKLIAGLPKRSRVALLQFSSSYQWHYRFLPSRPLETIQAETRAVQQSGGVTRTAQALEQALLEIQKFNPRKTKMVVMTDGHANDWTTANGMKTAFKINSLGVQTFVVGIGSNLNITQLRAMASRDDTLLTPAGFGALNQALVTRLTGQICSKTGKPQPKKEKKDKKKNEPPQLAAYFGNGACPPYFIKIKPFCYNFTRLTANWEVGEKTCRSINPNAHLPYFEEEKDWKDFLKNQDKIRYTSSVWLGLSTNNPLFAPNYTWNDFSQLKDTFGGDAPSKIDPWHAGEPNRKTAVDGKKMNKTCVVAQAGSQYKWMDDTCEKPAGYQVVCQISDSNMPKLQLPLGKAILDKIPKVVVKTCQKIVNKVSVETGRLHASFREVPVQHVVLSQPPVVSTVSSVATGGGGGGGGGSVGGGLVDPPPPPVDAPSVPVASPPRSPPASVPNPPPPVDANPIALETMSIAGQIADFLNINPAEIVSLEFSSDRAFDIIFRSRRYGQRFEERFHELNLESLRGRTIRISDVTTALAKVHKNSLLSKNSEFKNIVRHVAKTIHQEDTANKPVQPPPSNPDGPVTQPRASAVPHVGCFAGDSRVQTSRGEIPMKELRMGDKVLVEARGLGLSWEPVRWWLHREPSKPFEFVHITTETNKTLAVSHRHLIPFYDHEEDLTGIALNSVAHNSRFAHRAQPGNFLLTRNNRNTLALDRIVRVENRVETGYYAPITAAGTIVVDNVLASCYSEGFESHGLHHSFFRLFGQIFQIQQQRWGNRDAGSDGRASVYDEAAEQDVPQLLKQLMTVVEYITPRSS
jgi:Mg-chelatase subunit ChlD